MKNKRINYVVPALILICAGNNKVLSMNVEYEINYGSHGPVKFKQSSKYALIKLSPETKDGGASLLKEGACKFTTCVKSEKFKLLEFTGGGNLDEDLNNIKKSSTVQEVNAVYKIYEDENPFVPTGDLYLKFAEGVTSEASTGILEKFNLEIDQIRGEKEFIVRTTIKSPDPVKIAAELQQSKLLEVAEPDFSTSIQTEEYVRPKNKLFDQQWHLNNTGFHRGTAIGFKAGADARVEQAWVAMDKLGMPDYRGNTDVTIALIDDGFDLGHPALTGANKIVHPKDFSRNTENPIPDMAARDWHGTACAGVALANAEGGDVIGVAPHAKFMPIRFGPSISAREIERWFKHATDNGADIVSCSWGAKSSYYPLSSLASKAIENCAINGRNGKGCIILFAAGNDDHDINDKPRGHLNGFATHPHVIAVSASTSTDNRAPYSNYGKEISICAPSSGTMGILTTDVRGAFGYNPGQDYTYDFGGTSSATPLVAGVVGLMLSINPELTRTQVKEILQKTARKIGVDYDNNGHSRHFGYGCANAEEAVLEAVKDSVKESVGYFMLQIMRAIEYLDNMTKNLKDYAIMILGNTGAGKSTLINYLKGDKLEAVEENQYALVKRYKIQDSADISSSCFSKTTYPRIIEIGNQNFYDCPGFRDTRGPVQDIINAYSIYKFIEETPNIKIVLVSSENSVTDTTVERKQAFLKPLQQLGEIFKENQKDIMNNIGFVLTAREQLGHQALQHELSKLTEIKGFQKDMVTTLEKACSLENKNQTLNNSTTNIAFLSRPQKAGPLLEDERADIISAIEKVKFLSGLKPSISVSESTIPCLMQWHKNIMDEIRSIIYSFNENLTEYYCKEIKKSIENKSDISTLKTSFNTMKEKIKKILAFDNFKEKSEGFVEILEEEKKCTFNNYINHLKFIKKISPQKLTFNNDDYSGIFNNLQISVSESTISSLMQCYKNIMDEIRSMIYSFNENLTEYCCKEIKKSTENRNNISILRKSFSTIAKKIKKILSFTNFKEKSEGFVEILEEEKKCTFNNYISYLKFIKKISLEKLTFNNDDYSCIFNNLQDSPQRVDAFAELPSEERKENCLTVKGYIIGLSDIISIIKNKYEKEENIIKKINIFSLNSILIDADLNISANINILSPHWWIFDEKLIDISGRDALDMKEMNGENGWYFYGKGKEFHWSDEKLIIKSNGGIGMDQTNDKPEKKPTDYGYFTEASNTEYRTGNGGEAGAIEIVNGKDKYRCIAESGKRNIDGKTYKKEKKVSIYYGLTWKALDIHPIVGPVLAVPSAIINTLSVPFSLGYCYYLEGQGNGTGDSNDKNDNLNSNKEDESNDKNDNLNSNKEDENNKNEIRNENKEELNDLYKLYYDKHNIEALQIGFWG